MVMLYKDITRAKKNIKIKFYPKDEVKTVVLKGLDYVALVLSIDKNRDLNDEYLSQITFGDLDFDYWMYVLEACVLNMCDIRDELRTSSEHRDKVRVQLLGIVTLLNPHVYNEDRGWRR
jgi:hypothetical protein